MVKSFLQGIFLASALISSGAVYAGDSPVKLTVKAVAGTWELIEFTRILPDGKEIPWCKGANGLITYTGDGFMSAAINCDKDSPADAPAKAYDFKLLYAATYKFQNGDEIVHHVINSSQLDLLGQDMVRKVASLKNGVLTLTGQSANNRGAFRIVWKKKKGQVPS